MISTLRRALPWVAAAAAAAALAAAGLYGVGGAPSPGKPAADPAAASSGVLGDGCISALGGALVEQTGIETDASRSLDQEADRMMVQYRKETAERDAAARKGENTFARTEQLRLLLQSAEAKADEGAAVRAKEALEQRCYAAAAAEEKQSVDADTSPFLCSAVRAGGAAAGQNDPWEVCACARRYVSALEIDTAELQERVQSFLGKEIGGETYTADRLKHDFQPGFTRSGRSEVDGVSQMIALASEQIQTSIARACIRRQSGDANWGLYDQDFAYFITGMEETVDRVAKENWGLHVSELYAQLTYLRDQKNERQQRLIQQFKELDSSVMARHPEFYDADDANGFVAEMRPHAKNSDEDDYRYIEETSSALRAALVPAADLYRRRSRDLRAWYAYAAKDGYQPPQDPEQYGIRAPQALHFKFLPTRFDPVHCCLRVITKDGDYYDDPETHRWAHFPQGLLQAYPELEFTLSEDFPSVVFNFDFEKPGTQLLAGISEGADASERP